jgi:1-acyl-sn-glycerol-3-phosphate acyltransferase
MIPKIGRQVGTLALDGCFLTTQTSVRPITWWLSNRIGLQVSIPDNFYVPRGTLVLSNHRSLLDPFLVTFHLGRANWWATVPVRFPTTNKFAGHPLIGPAIKALGAYDIGVKPIERAKRLLFTRDLLLRKRSVLLFPEGRIVKDGRLHGEFQKGARMLFSHECPVLFVHLFGFSTESFMHPGRVNNPRMYFSEIVRGNPEEKVNRMEAFFASHHADDTD